MTPMVEWCRSRKRSALARLWLACLTLGVCVSACGSSGGGQQPGPRTFDNAGGVSGQNAADGDTAHTRTTGLSGGLRVRNLPGRLLRKSSAALPASNPSMNSR